MIAFHHFGASKLRGALLAPLLVLVASGALGQTLATADAALGTSAAKGLAPVVRQSIENVGRAAVTAPVSPALTLSGASYATAGIAMRNRRNGAIEISGIVGPIKRAYLYWAFLYSSTPPATQSIDFCTTTSSPKLPVSCASKVGTLLATGLDTCWRSAGVAIYRADVTSSMSGNGVYPLRLSSGASATGSGADPWTSLSFPAAEGVSLVVIGTGRQTVSVYDRGLAGATFYGSTSYTLTLPGGVRNTPVLWDNIGADGQTSFERASGFGVGKEKTFINNVQIAGPGASVFGSRPDSDWDGGVGSPSPKLWDVTGHALTGVSNGVTSLNVRFISAGATFDCVTPIANVVAY
jgi:hypothetical protein